MKDGVREMRISVNNNYYDLLSCVINILYDYTSLTELRAHEIFNFEIELSILLLTMEEFQVALSYKNNPK